MLGANVQTIHVHRYRDVDLVSAAVLEVSVHLAETAVQVPRAAGGRYSLPFGSPADRENNSQC